MLQDASGFNTDDLKGKRYFHGFHGTGGTGASYLQFRQSADGNALKLVFLEVLTERDCNIY